MLSLLLKRQRVKAFMGGGAESGGNWAGGGGSHCGGLISKPDSPAPHSLGDQVHKDTISEGQWYSAAFCISWAYEGRNESSRSTAHNIAPSVLPLPRAEGRTHTGQLGVTDTASEPGIPGLARLCASAGWSWAGTSLLPGEGTIGPASQRLKAPWGGPLCHRMLGDQDTSAIDFIYCEIFPPWRLSCL